MKSLITLLVATLALMPIAHGAPASTVPISAMPIVTNVLDNAYFPLIQPYPGRTTNDNFRATTANIFQGRGTGTFTNIYVTNLFVTNLIMLGGTNVASVNPTIGRIPYKDTTNTFGDSALYFIDTNTVGTVELDAETVGVTNLVTGGLVASVDTGLGYGVLTNIPFSDIALWTNDASILRPLFLQDVRMTNNRVYEQLRTDGAFVTAAQSINFLFAGTNQVNPFHQGMIFLASTISTNGAIVQLSTGDGTGAHLWLFNVFTNAPFTLPAGPLWDDPTQSVFVRGGAWSPTEPGESLELVNTGGGWDEIGRSNPNGPAPALGTNYWTNILGQLQPIDLTQELFWTNHVVWGPGTTNFLNRMGNNVVYGAFDSAGTTYPSFGVTNLTEASLALFGSGGNEAIIRGVTGVGLFDSLTSGNELVWFSKYFAPLTTNAILGGYTGLSPKYAWGNIVGWTNTVIGYWDNTDTNYSRLAITHGGSNVTDQIVFESQSSGTAGTGPHNFVFTNHITGGSSDVSIIVENATPKTMRMGINSGTGSLITTANSILMSANGLGVSVDSVQASIFPLTGSSMSLGYIKSPYNTVAVDSKYEAYGLWDTTGTNYSRLAISHTGTNGAIVFNSQSAGTAGTTPRPFSFTNAPIVLPSFTKAQKTALTPIEGMILFQTDNTPGIRVYQSGAWNMVSTVADP